jgi:hypothetical protein
MEQENKELKKQITLLKKKNDELISCMRQLIDFQNKHSNNSF